MKQLFILLILLFTHLYVGATTWDEPWQKEIFQKSQFFVLAKVTEANDSFVKIEIQKSFGATLSGTIFIDDFFLLDLCSGNQNHGAEFNFEVGNEGYFFLIKGENGNYQLPTPTSGFDGLADGNVYATYRHSYHQAMVTQADYELTHSVIWAKYHDVIYTTSEIENYIFDNLSYDPAGFEEDEIAIFFKQHAALETAYLMGTELNFDLLKKFIESDNFHLQISALRVMTYSKDKLAGKYLLDFITDKKNDNFTKVIAIWSLWNMNDENIRKNLYKLENKMSNESTGFGGNIMDPRVCTHFPTPQEAISELQQLKSDNEIQLR